MACERKFNESEATTGFFLLLGQQGNKAVLDWVMKEGLIPSRYECPKCKKDMRLVERKGTIDGFEWRCRVQSKENPHFVCRSVRKGTWFSDSRLSICVILRLTRYWFGKSMNEFVVNDLKINKNTVVDWYMFCREVCMVACVNESAKLGGEGKIVEIDESLFGKMKYGKGKRVKVIREWILPGTTIISDCWRAYECLSDEGYRHLTVNHSLTFKDPETGAHTNAIEGTWSAIKRNLKGHTAHVEGQFDSYLAEYMWRRSNEHKMIDANFKDYLKAIARVYPPHESDDQKQ
ncbi:mitotic-spindle organizing protein 2A [Trichonephila clavipes]|uniref:Mitotic-spindle organizing protein 2A n=1 Tax=Trichonephila clavipes TaxID=2585209 RepID=A0A8X6UWR3_TRICX|nr:mitotic-spindle organizing protein 2A [Trichonephila clavipes]